jgi:hypothetical protein
VVLSNCAALPSATGTLVPPDGVVVLRA